MNITEYIMFGPSGGSNALLVLDSLVPYMKPTVTNVGVQTDQDFKLDQQIHSVVSDAF